MIIMAIFLLANSAKAKGEEGRLWDRKGGGLRRCLATLCGLLIIPFFFHLIGFFPNHVPLHHIHDEDHTAPPLDYGVGDERHRECGRLLSFRVMVEDPVSQRILGLESLLKKIFSGCSKMPRCKAPEIPRSEAYRVRRNDEG